MIRSEVHEGPAVVIADDSVLIREGIVRLLEDAGHEVAGQATNAEELLDLVREQRPDLAIVDLRMPPGTGDEGISRRTRSALSSATASPSSSCRSTSRPTSRSASSTMAIAASATC